MTNYWLQFSPYASKKTGRYRKWARVSLCSVVNVINKCPPPAQTALFPHAGNALSTPLPNRHSPIPSLVSAGANLGGFFRHNLAAFDGRSGRIGFRPRMQAEEAMERR